MANSIWVYFGKEAVWYLIEYLLFVVIIIIPSTHRLQFSVIRLSLTLLCDVCVD